jgi:flavin-dependent thymidylate synthase
MRVELIDYTGKGYVGPWYAASLMIWTKRTRVEMSPGGLEEIINWSEEKKLDELRYMAATVPSSWEFCDYTFLITGVTRAFTHQLVRTRTASYAQQAMQVLDMSQGPGWQYHTGPTINEGNDEGAYRSSVYDSVMREIAAGYKLLVEDGARIEDARELLPTGILTNIVMKANLRSLCDLMRKRASPRNVSEFVDVLRQMRAEMLAVHPWAGLFLNRTADCVADEMYELLKEVDDKLLRTNLIKLVDQLLTNVGSGEMDEERS